MTLDTTLFSHPLEMREEQGFKIEFIKMMPKFPE